MVTNPIVKMNVQWFGVAVLVAAVLTGCASSPPTNPGLGICRSLHGNVTFTINGAITRLRTNMKLPAGATIEAGDSGMAFFQINGYVSTVKIAEKSTLELTKMAPCDPRIGGESETVLTLKSGTILGSVRKLSARSSYVIHTPNGVARIRGTDFAITAEALPEGRSRVTYTSVTGRVLVTALVDGKEVTQNLQMGQSWVPGCGNPTTVPPAVMQAIRSEIGPRPINPPDPNRVQPFNPILPFNGAGAPNTAVDIGNNPYVSYHTSFNWGPPPIWGPPPPVSTTTSAHR